MVDTSSGTGDGRLQCACVASSLAIRSRTRSRRRRHGGLPVEKHNDDCGDSQGKKVIGTDTLKRSGTRSMSHTRSAAQTGRHYYLYLYDAGTVSCDYIGYLAFQGRRKRSRQQVRQQGREWHYGEVRRLRLQQRHEDLRLWPDRPARPRRVRLTGRMRSALRRRSAELRGSRPPTGIFDGRLGGPDNCE